MIELKNEYKILSISEHSLNVDYHVTFRLNDVCNLECEYCRWYTGNNYDKPIECLDNIYKFFIREKFKTIVFYFHGGEPGIHPQCIQVLNHIRKLERETNIKTIVEFQTNLAYSKKRLKQILPLIDLLSISYHHVELVKKNLHRQFVKNFCYLKYIQSSIERFDIMLENVDNLEKFYEYILWFLDYKGIVYSEMIHSFCHYSKNPTTKTKHIEFYNKYNKSEQRYLVDGVEYNTNTLFAEGLNCKGCLCDAGSKDIVLNADGNVFTCGIEMTYYRLKCEPVIPVTNIISDKNYLNILRIKSKIKTKCKFEYCGGDFYIPRYGDNQ